MLCDVGLVVLGRVLGRRLRGNGLGGRAFCLPLDDFDGCKLCAFFRLKVFVIVFELFISIFVFTASGRSAKVMST